MEVEISYGGSINANNTFSLYAILLAGHNTA
jgi:hypothetical protein